MPTAVYVDASGVRHEVASRQIHMTGHPDELSLHILTEQMGAARS